MKKLLLFSIIILLSSCGKDKESSTELTMSVLEILQSETVWELQYDNEIYAPPINMAEYIEYQKFNKGTNPDGLIEEYYLRYNQGEEIPLCFRHSIMNGDVDGEAYYIVSNDNQKLVIYNPIGEANKLVYTYENGVMRYQYQEDGFEEDGFFPSATLTPSSVDLNSLNVCN